MSKHSKWSKVKYQKAVTDVKKAAVYTRMARIITVAAREGGGDANFNFKLRSAIDKAFSSNLPRDVIERAVARGTGAGEGDRSENVLYEGFGPGGVGILVEAVTDNRHRTSGNVKLLFSANGGNLGASGSVQRMFIRRGYVVVDAKEVGDDVQLRLIDAGADDVTEEDEGTRMTFSPDSLANVRDVAESVGLHVTESGFTWLAKERVEVADADGLSELVSAFEDDDDVCDVFTAAD